MLLTVFADASHCPKTLAGGWGAWAKREDWKYGRLISGTIFVKAPNSGVAEMHAIMHALQELQTQEAFDGVDALMLQSDSVRSLAFLKEAVPGARVKQHEDSAPIGNASFGSKSEAKAAGKIRDIVAQHELRLVLRHVRGHKTGNGRQWVNEQCDRMAREQMKMLRSQLQGLTSEPSKAQSIVQLIATPAKEG